MWQPSHELALIRGESVGHKGGKASVSISLTCENCVIRLKTNLRTMPELRQEESPRHEKGFDANILCYKFFAQITGIPMAVLEIPVEYSFKFRQNFYSSHLYLQFPRLTLPLNPLLHITALEGDF
jgi:hypothetical protein